LIAWNHNHNNLTIIVILNLFLGWTVAVWLGLFVWAFFFD
jgi:Superinfection immunity protein